MSVIFKKRLITIISLVVIVALAITACVIAWRYIYRTSSTGSQIQKMSTQQIVDRVIEQMNYRDIIQIEDSQLLKHYNVDSEIIDEFTMYVSSNIESAFEIACFKLNDEADVNALNTAVSEHMNNKAAGFMELSPSQYNMIMTYQTAAIKNYVFIIVSTDAEAAKQVFMDLDMSK